MWCNLKRKEVVTIIITRTSTLTGKEHFLDVEITQEQLDKFLSGTAVQSAFPHLSASDREFLLTGITAEEWESTFGESE